MGITRQHFAFGQGLRLAAEAANLLQPADRASEIAGHCAAHFVFGRAFCDQLGDHFVHPLFQHGKINTFLGGRFDLKDADAVEGGIAGRNADGQLLVAHQHIVEPA